MAIRDMATPEYNRSVARALVSRRLEFLLHQGELTDPILLGEGEAVQEADRVQQTPGLPRAGGCASTQPPNHHPNHPTPTLWKRVDG